MTPRLFVVAAALLGLMSALAYGQFVNLPIVNGTGVAGSVLYSDGSALITADATNFYWDGTHHRLGVGNTSPAVAVDVTGTVKASTSVVTPIHAPVANGTTAVQITKADGSTAVVDVDTTNSRVGIGSTTPAYPLDVAGNVQVQGGLILNTSTSRPACVVGIRGAVWVVEGAAGVTDTISVCLKAAADTYSWVQIVTGG